MKVHRHLIIEVIAILRRVMEEGAYSDKALEHAFKSHPKWGARDRHFVAETVYESIRWWTRIWAAMKHEPSYQEAHMVEFFDMLWSSEGKAVSFKRTSAEYHAIPIWLKNLLQQELRDNWPDVMEALNKKADVVLRANLIKTTVPDLMAALEKEEIYASPVGENYPLALRLTKRANVFRTQAFKNGLFEVQDAASQKVVEMLEPKPSERIIDACAGAGGKSLQIAMRMRNKGKVISLDIHDWKLKELRTRATRNGIDIIETKVIDSTKVIKRLEGTADAVLLDVPCTGIGALRRNPDTKWKLNQERLDQLRKTQSEILNLYSKLVKPKGRLVYATCSVLPSENEQQVHAFIKQNPEWKLVMDHHEWPNIQGFDGFYMALLTRA